MRKKSCLITAQGVKIIKVSDQKIIEPFTFTLCYVRLRYVYIYLFLFFSFF